MSDYQILAKKAALYGFPLIFSLEQVERYVTTGIGSNPAAPFNQFSHATILGSPKDTFVSLNNDTVYSMAQLDLSVGPVVLEIPATGDRYYVFPAIDAWTNNFSYIGTRSIGNDGGKILYTPPNWVGEIPAGFIQVKAPTTIVSLVGRWACEGPEDLHAVTELQKATKLYPLNSEIKGQGIPAPSSDVDSELIFWEKLRLFMSAFPTTGVFKEYEETFRPLGLLETGVSPYIEPSKEMKDLLVSAEKENQEMLIHYLKNGQFEMQNGWQLASHSFDFNFQYFEEGTVATDNWVMPEENNEQLDAIVLQRALSAMGGLWGNHGYEAAYAIIYVDHKAAPLDGQYKYHLTFNPEPPNEAFWSLTMYNVPDFFMVENEIARYSIGDRTKDLVYNEDGSLTLTLSSSKPTDPTELANWLPAPNEQFRPILRVYLPKEEIFNGDFEFPPIIKVSE